MLIEFPGVLGLQPGDVLLQAADLAVEELHAMAQPGCGDHAPYNASSSRSVAAFRSHATRHRRSASCRRPSPIVHARASTHRVNSASTAKKSRSP